MVAKIKSHNDNSWNSIPKYITFIVTKDCQLACKYCYLVGKNNKEQMSFDVAKAAIDYILKRQDIFSEDSVVLDFIGGEPFLEIDLIDQICDYFKNETQKSKHPWAKNYSFSISTNGLLYHKPAVQNFLIKNGEHTSVGITIDGTERKHNLNRIYKETGRGSYQDVVKNIPLWLLQFTDPATKVTVSSEDLPYVAESVLHLFALGIHIVNINVVFEDVWKEEDDLLFEEQLMKLADEMLEKRLFEENYCSFFDEYIGKPMNPVNDNQNWCGSGNMLAIDSQGNFYPCTRFAKYSLKNKEPLIIGNVKDGLDLNKLRPFRVLSRTIQSPQKCLDCEVARGCAWCLGENYDTADTNTIFQRSTAICKMHKARVRANNYYWNRLFRLLEKEELDPNSVIAYRGANFLSC